MTIDPDKFLKNYYITKLRIIYLFSVLAIGYWIYLESPTWRQIIIVFYSELPRQDAYYISTNTSDEASRVIVFSSE